MIVPPKTPKIMSPLQEETLIEEKEALIVEPSSSKPSLRIAHFLKPSFPSSSKQTEIIINPPPKITLPSKPISPIFKTLSSKVLFNGWKISPKKYTLWVEKLQPLYESTWKKSFIYDAIMGSIIDIPRCKASIFSLVDQWCPETNTFVLPWGEISVTLEDVMFLGGFSVKGGSVFSEINCKEMYLIEDELHKRHLEVRRSKSKKASQQQWMDIWTENGSEFEHEAFIAYWLSRYVFPASDCGTINKNVFQIAILLARGTRICLGPAVLASIYRDLRLLKEKIGSLRDLGDHDDSDVSTLPLWSHMKLLQVWIWQRFPKLSPKSELVSNELPIIRKWHKAKLLSVGDVGLPIVFSKDDFHWRPYSNLLKKGLLHFDLECYCRFIRVSDLVGLDCVEQYLPHRVAMQFGLDQNVPIAFRRLCDTREIAWRYYDRPIGCMKLYIPAKDIESGVTTRYLKWWENSYGKEYVNWGCERGDVNAKQCGGNSNVSKTTAEMFRIKMENNDAVPPGFTSRDKRVATGYTSDEHQPTCKRSKQSPCHIFNDNERCEVNPSCGSSLEIIALQSDDNSDDDDHKILSQLFRPDGCRTAERNGALSLSRRGSHSSSAGDNACIIETNSAAKHTGCTLPTEVRARKGLNIEDGMESIAGSLIRTPISVDENEGPTSVDGSSKSSGIDLLYKIARLQKIIDMVKASKQPKSTKPTAKNQTNHAVLT